MPSEDVQVEKAVNVGKEVTVVHQTINLNEGK
ncbi:hypothetical protein FOMA001_g13756 [Fusarium oxysporum f. sp. matthiolae]|jgi:hypothetical protein|nr:hypothetical protein FOMA001_g13756 [Fusarium oxysporum f. sp. matthiolae]